MAVIGMMIVMLPLFLLGMYERDGQPLEVVAGQFIQANFVKSKIRPYQTENYYELLMKSEDEKEDEDAICEEK